MVRLARPGEQPSRGTCGEHPCRSGPVSGLADQVFHLIGSGQVGLLQRGLAVRTQQLGGLLAELDPADASLGLGRAHRDLAAELEHGLADGQHPGVVAHVAPAQPVYLTAPTVISRYSTVPSVA